MSNINIEQSLCDEPYYDCAAPCWRDSCNHVKGSYIGTFTNREKRGGVTSPDSPTRDGVTMDCHYDVYVFDGCIGQSVCIRYGNEGSKYISPGTVLDLLATGARTGNAVYLKAFKLISDAGIIRWERSVHPAQ